MRRRAYCVRQLEVEDMACRDVVIMPATVTAAMFGSQCSSLLKLRIAAVDVGLDGPGIAALTVLTRLRHLGVWASNRSSPRHLTVRVRGLLTC